jgi:hypothetical protein
VFPQKYNLQNQWCFWALQNEEGTKVEYMMCGTPFDLAVTSSKLNPVANLGPDPWGLTGWGATNSANRQFRGIRKFTYLYLVMTVL